MFIIQNIIKNYASVINRIRSLAKNRRRLGISVRPGPGLKPPSSQASKRTSFKLQAGQATSYKLQAPWQKLQASSRKLQAPRSLNQGKSFTAHVSRTEVLDQDKMYFVDASHERQFDVVRNLPCYSS